MNVGNSIATDAEHRHGQALQQIDTAATTTSEPAERKEPATRQDNTKEENNRLHTILTIDRNDGKLVTKRRKHGPDSLPGVMRPQDKDATRM